MKKILFPLSCSLYFLLFSFQAIAQLKIDKENVKQYGFSQEKLIILDSVMRSYVDNKDFSAIQTAIVKNGKIIHFDNYGYSEISSKKLLDENDIFRIASMTKPIVSVALMMLYEEGKFKLDDPLYKFIP